VIQVRHGVADDARAAVAVWSAANDGSGPPGHADRLLVWAVDPDAVLVIAVEASTTVGMVLLLAGRADDGAGPLLPELGHLTGLAVHPEYRRQGIGTQLLIEAKQAALDAGRTRITAWVRDHNQVALDLFARHGFAPTGRTATDSAGTAMVLLEASGDEDAPPV